MYSSRSMMLINSLMAHATDARWEEFMTSLEKLNVNKAVIVRLSLFPSAYLQFMNITLSVSCLRIPSKI